MSSQITAKSLVLPIMPVFLGSWFAIIASTPAQGQVNHNDRMLLTQAVFESLPPPPGFLQDQPVEFNQFGQSSEFYQPTQSQYNQNFQRYSVYVENRTSQTLQQIRRVEPTAYLRQYNGRSVVQAGVFNSLSNAQQRVLELQSMGIYGASIAGFSSGQQTPDYSDYPANSNNVSNRPRYYVTIPAKSQDLPTIAGQVRQITGLYTLVNQRTQPLGPHVAVGPFNQRAEATRVNKFLRDRGFGNARVFYGK
jgi:hypothetical protein